MSEKHLPGRHNQEDHGNRVRAPRFDWDEGYVRYPDEPLPWQREEPDRPRFDWDEGHVIYPGTSPWQNAGISHGPAYGDAARVAFAVADRLPPTDYDRPGVGDRLMEAALDYDEALLQGDSQVAIAKAAARLIALTAEVMSANDRFGNPLVTDRNLDEGARDALERLADLSVAVPAGSKGFRSRFGVQFKVTRLSP